MLRSGSNDDLELGGAPGFSVFDFLVRTNAEASRIEGQVRSDGMDAGLFGGDVEDLAVVGAGAAGDALERSTCVGVRPFETGLSAVGIGIGETVVEEILTTENVDGESDRVAGS